MKTVSFTEVSIGRSVINCDCKVHLPAWAEVVYNSRGFWRLNRHSLRLRGLHLWNSSDDDTCLLATIFKLNFQDLRVSSHDLPHCGFNHTHWLCGLVFNRVKDLKLETLLFFEEILDFQGSPVRVHVIFYGLSRSNLQPFSLFFIVLCDDAHGVRFAKSLKIFKASRWDFQIDFCEELVNHLHKIYF